ncbi:MAG: disulfide bond formation protein B [Gammaproteobacteria bacterium]|nr:disulfide bond formation protein B [Gammaproteobacteria bacterium]
MKLIQQLNSLAQHSKYWLSYIFGSLALLTVALYFQYVNHEPPCVMCIQVRLWISLLMFVTGFGFLTRNNRALNLVSNLSVALIAAALTERAYMLLGTERGFVFSDCGFDPGLPTWLPLDTWLPWLYRVEATCGYTPEVIFGITMAEILIVFFVLLLVMSIGVLLANLVGLKSQN